MKLLFAIAILGLLAACPAATPAPVTPQVVDVPITEASLSDFMQQRFPAAVAAGTIKLDFGDGGGVGTDVIDELSLLGITTTGQLAAIVPTDFQDKGIAAIASSSAPTTNVAGLVRDLLIIHDVKAYFEIAWRNGWSANGPGDFPAPAAYGVDMDVMSSYGAFGGSNLCGGGYDDDYGDDYGDDPCGGGDYGNPCGGGDYGNPCGG